MFTASHIRHVTAEDADVIRFRLYHASKPDARLATIQAITLHERELIDARAMLAVETLKEWRHREGRLCCLPAVDRADVSDTRRFVERACGDELL